MPPPAANAADAPFDWMYYLRMAGLIYLGSNVMTGLTTKFLGPPATDALAAAAVFDPSATAAAGAGAAAPDAYGKALGPQGLAVPMWPEGASLDLYLYFTTSETGDIDFDTTEPAVLWRNLEYSPMAKIDLVKELELELPESVRHNGSYWADLLLVNGHGSPNPADPSFNAADTYHSRKLLTRYQPKKRIRKEKNLLSGESDDAEPTEAELEQESKAMPIVSHWHSNLTLGLIGQRPDLNLAAAPEEVRDFVTLEPSGQRTADGKRFHYPILFANDFWNLRNHYVQINESTVTLPIRIQLTDVAHWKFQLYTTMSASLEKQATAAGGSGGEIDEFKRTLIETNPWLLGTTVVVSVLHMLFEFLAFSSDIGDWRKKGGDLTGVSLRTILTNVVTQLIILLYLLDSSDETSYMILFGQGIGLLIEAWKITKVVNVTIVPTAHGSLLPYRVAFEDKKELSASEKLTQEYDALAFRLVSYVMVPILVGYAVYSVLYQSHRSWYSYAVTTAAQAVYMLGFASLIPGLVINYKLKSVAHLPFKTLIYKTLSTVVDDFFAFVIKQPTLHRLACFRDDAVFLVLLYQRWIYRVDPSRVNEYGQGGLDDAAKAELNADGSVAAVEPKKTK